MMFNAVAAVSVADYAAFCDLGNRRIPNLLTFGSAFAAATYHFSVNGFSGVFDSLLGWACGTVLYFPMFALGGMGAGDVKLLAALGAWLGPGLAVWIALFSALAG